MNSTITVRQQVHRKLTRYGSHDRKKKQSRAPFSVIELNLFMFLLYETFKDVVQIFVLLNTTKNIPAKTRAYFNPNGNKLRGRPKTTLPIVYNRDLALIQHPIRLQSSKDMAEITELAQDRNSGGGGGGGMNITYRDSCRSVTD